MKKKLFVISTEFLQLMSVNLDSFGFFTDAKINDITHEDLQTTFNTSAKNGLIACDNAADAFFIMRIILSSCPELIHEKVKLFAVPVVYYLEINEKKLPQHTSLSSRDLVLYANSTPILPCEVLFDDDAFATKKERAEKRRAEKKRIDVWLKRHSDTLNIYKLDGLEFKDVREAHYLSTNGNTIKSVNLRSNTEKQCTHWIGRAIGFFSNSLLKSAFRDEPDLKKEDRSSKCILI